MMCPAFPPSSNGGKLDLHPPVSTAAPAQKAPESRDVLLCAGLDQRGPDAAQGPSERVSNLGSDSRLPTPACPPFHPAPSQTAFLTACFIRLIL
ncbi:hypothetical protein I79_004241 [Cricetulus griseus]|uniref:Uncharacterized protein n=1 Tax=Cricetulus griseus TaxID=10029 RepID=G3H274_CRIGR|nr:hypothetical protein I79_004241 [Cricetulus griseus]